MGETYFSLIKKEAEKARFNSLQRVLKKTQAVQYYTIQYITFHKYESFRGTLSKDK